MARITKKAKEGYYYTDGQTFVKAVELPPTADESVWYQISEEEYERIMAKMHEDLDKEGSIIE